MMLISKSLDKEFRLLKFSRKIVTSLSGYFSIEKLPNQKYFYAQLFYLSTDFQNVAQSAAYFTINFVPNIVKRIFCLAPNYIQIIPENPFSGAKINALSLVNHK